MFNNKSINGHRTFTSFRRICFFNNLPFPKLYNFVKLLLSLPHSSACVGRIFSVINLNKTKTRNRLSTETLSGLLHTKQFISKITNQNCYDYDISESLLLKHNNAMYAKI